jgi:hypothetical protein
VVCGDGDVTGCDGDAAGRGLGCTLDLDGVRRFAVTEVFSFTAGGSLTTTGAGVEVFSFAVGGLLRALGWGGGGGGSLPATGWGVGGGLGFASG